MYQVILTAAVSEVALPVPQTVQNLLAHYLNTHGEDGLYEFQEWWTKFTEEPSTALLAAPLAVQSDVVALLQQTRGEDLQVVDDVIVRLLRIISRVVFLETEAPKLSQHGE